MKVIYEFSDGLKSEVEVAGELIAEYCVIAGIDPDEPPQTLEISEVEKKVDRKHNRPHKYTGFPVSLDEVSENGEEAANPTDEIAEIESAMVTEQAMETLTKLQRYCFVEVCINGRTQQSVADEIGKSRENVKYAIDAAKKNLKKYFS